MIDQPEEGALPGSAGTHDRDHLATIYGQVNALQHLTRPVSLPHVAADDECGVISVAGEVPTLAREHLSQTWTRTVLLDHTLRARSHGGGRRERGFRPPAKANEPGPRGLRPPAKANEPGPRRVGRSLVDFEAEMPLEHELQERY